MPDNSTAFARALTNIFFGPLSKMAGEAGCEISELRIPPLRLHETAELLVARELPMGGVETLLTCFIAQEEFLFCDWCSEVSRSPGALDDLSRLWAQHESNALTARGAAEALGLLLTGSEEDTRRAVDAVLATNPKEIEDYLRGRKQAIGPLVGRVMKSQSGLNPQKVRELLEARITKI